MATYVAVQYKPPLLPSLKMFHIVDLKERKVLWNVNYIATSQATHYQFMISKYDRPCIWVFIPIVIIWTSLRGILRSANNQVHSSWLHTRDGQIKAKHRDIVDREHSRSGGGGGGIGTVVSWRQFGLYSHEFHPHYSHLYIFLSYQKQNYNSQIKGRQVLAYSGVSLAYIPRNFTLTTKTYTYFPSSVK